MGDAGLGLLVVNHLDLGLLLRPRPSSHCGPLYLLSLLLTRGHFRHLFVRPVGGRTLFKMGSCHFRSFISEQRWSGRGT